MKTELFVASRHHGPSWVERAAVLETSTVGGARSPDAVRMAEANPEFLPMRTLRTAPEDRDIGLPS